MAVSFSESLFLNVSLTLSHSFILSAFLSFSMYPSISVSFHHFLFVSLCLPLVLQCFAVRSLGWVEISEEEMAPGKSSVAVNNCIRQLSYHKHNLHDTAGIWGEVCACVLYGPE